MAYSFETITGTDAASSGGLNIAPPVPMASKLRILFFAVFCVGFVAYGGGGDFDATPKSTGAKSAGGSIAKSYGQGSNRGTQTPPLGDLMKRPEARAWVQKSAQVAAEGGAMGQQGVRTNQGLLNQYQSDLAEVARYKNILEGLAASGQYDTANYEKAKAIMGASLAFNNQVGPTPASENSGGSDSAVATSQNSANGGKSVTTGGFSSGSQDIVDLPAVSRDIQSLGAAEQVSDTRNPSLVVVGNTANPDAQDAAALAGDARAAHSPTQLEKAKIMAADQGTYNPPGRGLASVGVDGQQQPSEEDELIAALPELLKAKKAAQEKANAAEKAKESLARAPLSTGNAPTIVSGNENLADVPDSLNQISRLGNALSSRTSDLGNWILQSVGARAAGHKNGAEPTNPEEAEKVVFDKTGFSVGALALMLMLLSLGYFALNRNKLVAALKKENKEARVRSELIDSKTQDYDVSLAHKGAKKIAVLEVWDRATKEAKTKKELMSGSVIMAQYLPASYIEKKKFKKQDHVKYRGEWDFEVTSEPVKIAVRVYNDEIKTKKAV